MCRQFSEISTLDKQPTFPVLLLPVGGDDQLENEWRVEQHDGDINARKNQSSPPPPPVVCTVGGDQLEYKRLVADHVGDTYLR